MKILVVGGSYFLGRWFVQLTYMDHDITVLNRGSIPVGHEGVRELKGDRHDRETLSRLFEDDADYETVVDFCAYEKGDIASLLEQIRTDSLKRYIFISTVDVYKRGTGRILDEEAPLEDRLYEGEQGAYIAGKICLEGELEEECKRHAIKGVSVRPAVIYGPGNYAMRENIYLEWIEKAGRIIHPVGADGFWQMIHVRDAARGIAALCKLPPDELKRAYNFCTEGTIGYDCFEEALSEATKPFTRIEMPLEEVLKQGIPLPFPLTREESETYKSLYFKNLGIKETPLIQGLRECTASLGY